MANQVLSIPTTPYIARALFGSMILSGVSGNFSVGDEIQGDTSGAKAILTEVSGTTVRFYYIESSPGTFTAFNGSEAITNNTDTGAATGSGTLTVENFNINFLTASNYPRVRDSGGGNKVNIKVVAGPLKFSVNNDPDVNSPSYAADATLQLTMRDGNVLHVEATAGLDSFEVVV